MMTYGFLPFVESAFFDYDYFMCLFRVQSSVIEVEKDERKVISIFAAGSGLVL